MRSIAICLLVAALLSHCTHLCVQGAVRLTNRMPARAKSGPSFELLRTRVHRKMAHKMDKMNKMKTQHHEEGGHEGGHEDGHEGVAAGSAKEEVTFLPTKLAAATVGEVISFGLLDGEEVNGEILIY
jgi:hypothetical protein